MTDPNGVIGAPVDEFERDFVLQGPGQYLFTLEDQLQIDSLCSLASITLTISGMMLTGKGELKPFSFTHAPNSTRTLATTRQSIGSGWLQHVRVLVTSGAPLVGQCFAWVRICRGLTASALTHGSITSGYVTAAKDVYFPGAQPTNPLDESGAPLSIAVTTPGAGVEWSQTVPTGARWRLTEVFYQLVTSAAAATRSPRLLIDDGANLLIEVPAAVTQIASLTGIYSYGAGAGGPITADANFLLSVIPNDLWLTAGFRVRSSTANIQAADQYSAVRLGVQEYLEGN